jgi:hypothetical protein
MTSKVCSEVIAMLLVSKKDETSYFFFLCVSTKILVESKTY